MTDIEICFKCKADNKSLVMHRTLKEWLCEDCNDLLLKELNSFIDEFKNKGKIAHG